MTNEQALAWFEGGIRLESAEQAGEAFRLAAAALRVKGQLVEALEPNASPPGPDFLEWLADRFVLLGESPNVAFVLALRRKAEKMRAALKAAKETPHG